MASMMGQRGVLVVEDDPELLTLFASVLEAEGYRVFRAGDGQAGLDTLGTHAEEIGMVITDLGLPRLGGIELIARIRATRPGVKIIGTSGFGGESVREKVLAAGADTFIQKPFSLADVIEKVKGFRL